MARISSYLIIVSAWIGLAMLVYNIFANNYFAYVPLWFKWTISIVFFLMWAKFMEMVGESVLS
jgi:hypothetical protein